MKKIKNLMQGIFDESKELIKKFPLTLLIILLLTCYGTYLIAKDFDNAQKANKVLYFLFTTAVGVYFAENFFKEKKYKIISYVVSAGISGLFTYFLFINETSDKGFIKRFYFTYVIAIFAIIIFKILKNEKVELKEYLAKTFRNFLNCTIIYGILALGTTLLVVIFVELILNGKYGNSLYYLHIWLLGLYYVPSVIYSISMLNKNELNAFYKGLILKVLLPISIIAMAIIYIYIAKILILRKMPKNIIFLILAGIFTAVFLICTMAEYFAKDNQLLKKISKYWPIAYSPFMLLEIYSLGVRINEYGITPIRYAGIVFMVLQIIILFLCIYKNKEKLNYIFIICIPIAVIGLLSPLNYEKTTFLSQLNKIKILENENFEDLSENQKKQVKGGYYYLYYNDYEIPEYVTEETKEKIKDYVESSYDYNEYNYREYIYYHSELDNVDISNYSNLTKYTGMFNYEEDNSEENLKIEEGKYFIYVQDELIEITNFVNEIINENKRENYSSNYVEEYISNNPYIYTEFGDIYITDIYMHYSTLNDTASYLDIDGYLLEK